MAASQPNGIDDEDYDSSQDSDFALDEASGPANDRSDSDDDDDDDDDSAEPAGRRRHRNDAAPKDVEDYDNSGDEAIIKKGRKRRRLAQADGSARDGEPQDGGMIKTRRQRAAEKEQKREVVTSTAAVTFDVDAVWAEMMAKSAARMAHAPQDGRGENTNATGEVANATAKGAGTDGNEDGVKPAATRTADGDNDESGMVRIKQTYKFAGRVRTEEKLVPRDSAEAKLHLAAAKDEAAAQPPPPARTLKKRFRSRFEPPMADGATARTDLDLSVTGRMKAGKEAKAKKLNVVEKSRMDWAGYVEKEGLREELETANKSKGSYAAREDFLARSEAQREGEAKRARLAGRK